MVAKLHQLISRVQARLAQATGPGTNTYSEDVIAEHLQTGFDYYFEKYWWPDYIAYSEWTLDGTLGVVTADLTSLLDRTDDIDWIKSNDCNVVRLRKDVAPSSVTGSAPRFWIPYASATKVFKIVPYAATGTIEVRYRVRPSTFIGTSDVNMDNALLVTFAAVQYLASDGSNPDATNMQMRALSAQEDRVNHLMNTQQTLGNNAQSQLWPTEWFVG